MKEYDIWVEGSITSGGDATSARILASKIRAKTFKEACLIISKTSLVRSRGYFDLDRLTFWGCQLYDNEEDARRFLG